MVIRLGIIGLSADQGAWATLAHAGPLKSPSLSEKYAITALATSSPESAKAAAKAHGIPESKAYSSPEAIANDPDVDMVVVSVKVWHSSITKKSTLEQTKKMSWFPRGIIFHTDRSLSTALF